MFDVAGKTPAGELISLVSEPSQVLSIASVRTVNRKLAAVSSFYAHQARNDEGPGELLAAWRTGGRGGPARPAAARTRAATPSPYSTGTARISRR